MESMNYNNPRISEAMDTLYSTYYYKMQNNDYDIYQNVYNEGFAKFERKCVNDINDQMIEQLKKEIPSDNHIFHVSRKKNLKLYFEAKRTILNFPTNALNTDTRFSKFRKFVTISHISSLMILKQCDLFKLNQNGSYLSSFNWSNITELIKSYFYPNLAKYLQKMVEDYSVSDKLINEVKEEEFEVIIQELRGRRKGVNNEQFELLKYIIYKHRYYHPIYESFSISFKSFITKKWNKRNDERKIWEIYSVHQMLINHNNPSSTYNIFNFVQQNLRLSKNVETAEILQFYLLINKPIDIHSIYIIHDDIKQIINIIFSITYLINYIINNGDKKKNKQITNINIAIIPHRVQLAMDKTVFYQHDLPNFAAINGGTKFIISRNDKENDPEMIYQNLLEIYDKIDIEKGSNDRIMIVVDRRSDDDDTVYFYPFYDDMLFEPLFANYLLMFTFHFNPNSNPNNCSVICYFWWAVYQKVRFFPEMVVSVIPKLFSKDIFINNPRARIEMIYSNSFKNGWGVHLKDIDFDKAYKRYTGFDHVSCNYNRKWIKNGIKTISISSLKEKKIKSKCDEFSDLNDCEFMRNISAAWNL